MSWVFRVILSMTIKWKPFHVEHLGEFNPITMTETAILEQIMQYRIYEVTLTLFVDGVIYGYGGIDTVHFLFDGREVGEAWYVLIREIPDSLKSAVMLSIFRVFRSEMKNRNFARIQCVVKCRDEKANKAAKKLGFVRESIEVKNLMPDGSKVFIYGMVIS